ncbi:unnamed protein product [Peniophora sp. CBMAI 1063]|nr:unnamed protein product [Peniophora sp. CBMAI 1063]
MSRIATTMGNVVRVARERSIRRALDLVLNLPPEVLLNIFITLSYLDTPTLENPLGWYMRVCAVCSRWRKIALGSIELWARNAGAFPSPRMTDVLIRQRAGRTFPLSLNGHFEDHRGPGYVLTDYQLSLIEAHATRLRSLVHDEYMDWSELFYRLRTFPQLEAARIWDDSGPEMWYECINAPKLECLYLNNGLIPFNAPSLRYLRVDLDNVDWRQSRDVFGSYDDGVLGDDDITPTAFPTRELLALLQRSPQLERLIITDMPALLQEELPDLTQLHVRLPRLRGLHLAGKSRALADLWQRLIIPPDAQIFIDTDYLDEEKALKEEVLEVVADILISPVYDSIGLGMTTSYDMMMQLWSSETCSAPGLDLSTSLQLTEPMGGPAFTLKLSFATNEFLKTFTDNVIVEGTRGYEDHISYRGPYGIFQHNVATRFHARAADLLRYLSPSWLKHIDIADLPFVYDNYMTWLAIYERDVPVTRLLGFKAGTQLPRRVVILNWESFSRLAYFAGPYIHSRALYYLPAGAPFELTFVNFPCVACPSQKRYDENLNADAWNLMYRFLEAYFSPGKAFQGHLLKLTLAESYSDRSNMERSEEPVYEHTIPVSYEDAVNAVTQKGYRQIARFVPAFQDLRVNSWHCWAAPPNAYTGPKPVSVGHKRSIL